MSVLTLLKSPQHLANIISFVFWRFSNCVYVSLIRSFQNVLHYSTSTFLTNNREVRLMSLTLAAIMFNLSNKDYTQTLWSYVIQIFLHVLTNNLVVVVALNYEMLYFLTTTGTYVCVCFHIISGTRAFFYCFLFKIHKICKAIPGITESLWLVVFM